MWWKYAVRASPSMWIRCCGRLLIDSYECTCTLEAHFLTNRLSSALFKSGMYKELNCTIRKMHVFLNKSVLIWYLFIFILMKRKASISAVDVLINQLSRSIFFYPMKYCPPTATAIYRGTQWTVPFFEAILLRGWKTCAIFTQIRCRGSRSINWGELRLSPTRPSLVQLFVKNRAVK